MILVYESQGTRYRIRLDDGREIVAVLARHAKAVRKHTCILRLDSLDGWGVTINLHTPPKMHRIVELHPPRAR